MKRARHSLSPPSVARCLSSPPPASTFSLAVSSPSAEPFDSSSSSSSSAASHNVNSLGRLMTDSALRLTLDIGAAVCASFDATDLGRLVVTAKSLHRMLRHAVGVAPGAYIPNRIVAADTDPLWRAAFMRGVCFIECYARRLVRLHVGYDHDGTAFPTIATLTAIVAASRTTLQAIDLMGVSYTAHPELLRAMCNCPQLSRLELDVSERADANRWSEVVAEAASHEMPRLTELEVVGDAIRPDTNAPSVVLGAMLRSCMRLRTLHIDDLPYDCIAQLPASLTGMIVTLRHRTHAGDVAGGATVPSLSSCVAEFGNVLGKLNQLETLLLWCCDIPGRESALDQLAPLVLPPSLRHLQLYEDDTDGRSRPRRWPPVHATHDFEFRACANMADLAGILRCTPHLRHLEVSGPRNPADRYLGARARKAARAEFVAAVRNGGGAALECARFERLEFTLEMIRVVFECWRNLRTLSCEVSSAALLEADRLLETRRPPTLVNWRFVGAHAKSMSGDGTASAQRVFELSSF